MGVGRCLFALISREKAFHAIECAGIVFLAFLQCRRSDRPSEQ
jgi:hypothetical protein